MSSITAAGTLPDHARCLPLARGRWEEAIMTTQTQDWTPTTRVLPPNNQVVRTMDSSGHVQELKRNGNLWWFPNGSMYVYYTPKLWQPKDA